MRTKWIPIVLCCWGAVALPGSLAAETAPLHLRSPEQVQMFHRITNRLNCLCGCHGLVSQCGHVAETCFAVQARIFIETRIREGQSEEAIVRGFSEGFGDRVVKDAQLQELLRNGNEGVVRGFVSGFGPNILHEAPPVWPRVLLVAVSVLLLLLLILRLLRPSRLRGRETLAPREAAAGPGESTAAASRPAESIASPPKPQDEDLAAALGRLRELDR